MRRVVAAVALLFACGDSHDLAERAAEVRELDFAYYPEVARISPEQWRDQVSAEVAASSDSELRLYAETYGRLGYFAVDLDLRPILIATRSDWVGGYYQPADASITLIGDADDDILVHEYVHALQDQHFGFADFDLTDTTDGFLSRRAIIEGDAVLAQRRFILQEEGTDLAFADWLALFNLYRSYAAALLTDAEYPIVFLDYPSFCYAYGLEFTAHHLTGATIANPAAATLPPYDWGRENQLFIDPHADTCAAILRLGNDVDEHFQVGLTAVPAELAASLTVVDWDILGEWYVYLLLTGAGNSVTSTRAMAAGWDGDAVLFVEDGAANHGLIWSSTWDDANVAINVAESLWTIYGRNSTGLEPEHFALADDGETVWIERRAERLVVVKNIDFDLIAPLVAAAFAPVEARRRPRTRPSLAALLSQRARSHR